MTTSTAKATVEGECAHEVFNALRQMERGDSDDGDATLLIALPRDEMAALQRALMRVEAELLLEDAAVWGTGTEKERTDGQRGFAALVLLTERTVAALDGPPEPGSARESLSLLAEC